MENIKIKRIPSVSPYTMHEKIRMSIWWLFEIILFRPSLHKMNGFRCFLLRLFGAKIGRDTFIHPRAKIWFPWNLKIGSNSGIGFDALIYNLDVVDLGDYVTVAQRVHINTGSHDYRDPAFNLITRPVRIKDGAFLGADSYINMGITIGVLSVIGARSVVVTDLPDNMVCVGHPCKPIKSFEMRLQGAAHE